MTGAGSALAQSGSDLSDLKAEVEALREGQQQMQKDLAEIKKLLEQGARPAGPGQQPFKPTDIVLGDVPSKGAIDAPVTLVEFSDYHCPFCRRHATTVLPQILEEYVDTGKVRFVMRENPIPNLHPRATEASEVALCAKDQGKYWEMHDMIFANQRKTTDEDFRQFAADVGLDAGAFDECMGSDRHLAQIRADQEEAQRLGISGTPSFVLGRADPDDPSKVRLTRYIRGAQQFAAFSGAIDALLEGEDDEGEADE